MENTQGNAPSQDKGAMAQGQQNPPPPYQEVSAMGDAQPAQFPGYSQQAYQNPYPGQPYQGQPYPGQPYPGQPYQGQPYLGQPYPGQVYPGQVYPGQTVITVQHAPLSPPENDYLVYSIITLLCCCFPLGIAALVFSISTRQHNTNGSRVEAKRNSQCARTLNHISLGLGLATYVFVIVCLIVITQL